MQVVLAKAFLCLSIALTSAVTFGAQDQTERQHAVESTKQTALQALSDVLAKALNTEYPSETRVVVYLESEIDNFYIQRATLTVDLEKQPTIDYSAAQVKSLQQGTADRLLTFNATPGKHRLKIDYSGYLKLPSGNTIDIEDSTATEFTTTANSQGFILPATPKLLRPSRTLAESGKRETMKLKTVSYRPDISYVRYLWDTGNTFQGVLELLTILGNNADNLPDDFHGLMGQVYADFEMRDHAMRSSLEAHKKKSNAAERATLWLRIAQLDYERGNYLQAGQALALVPKGAEPSQQAALLGMRARILMAQEEYARAATLFDQATRISVPNDENNGTQSLRLRFNKAIAMIKSGQTAEGRAALDRLGRSASGSVMGGRANLVLGYHLLDAAGVANAREVFQRIPLNGPHTNRGLLGLGWAALAPNARGDDADRPKRALAAWSRLAKGNLLDPAVQEALVAAAYAVELQGDFNQASRSYQRAADIYTGLETQLKREAARLRRGELSNAILDDDSSAIPHTGDVENVYTGHAYHAHAKNYRDLIFLEQALAEKNTAPQIRQNLEKTADEEIEIAQEELAEAIEKQLVNLKQYQIKAGLGQLRNFNRTQATSQ